MDFDTDVLICGAGAAGLTLALDLARRNVQFRLVERQDTPFHGSRGKGIQPRTLEVFEDLGIVDRAVALGGPYPPSASTPRTAAMPMPRPPRSRRRRRRSPTPRR